MNMILDGFCDHTAMIADGKTRLLLHDANASINERGQAEEDGRDLAES